MIMLFSFIVIFFVLGLIFGSFLNVLIYRTHQKKSIVRGRSICPNCKKQLQAKDLIPIFSYLALKGKCRYCKKPISVQYPLVELSTGLIFTTLYLYFLPQNIQSWLTLILWIFVSSLLIASFVYDLKRQILPDKFLVPAIVASLVYIIIMTIFFAQYSILYRFLGSFAFALFFFALWFISKGKWIGDGDIRLAFLMGLILSLPQLLVAIFFGLNLAAVVALILLLSKRKKRKDSIAFGPFLIIGTFLGLFFAQPVINWYFALFRI